jgi:hypothetical protein
MHDKEGEAKTDMLWKNLLLAMSLYFYTPGSNIGGVVDITDS